MKTIYDLGSVILVLVNSATKKLLRERKLDGSTLLAITNVLALRNPVGEVVDYVSWGGNSYGGYTWNKNQGNDETVALHRNKVVCTSDCSKPDDWTVSTRAPYGQDFYYDKDGNQTIDKDKGLAMGEPRGLHMYYNLQNLPIQIGDDITYKYHASGQRFYKNVAGTEEYYIMDGNTILAVTDENGAIQHWNLYG
ncbi:MAG: hypothetical protein WC967_15365, partial [Balneolaceae bacterium]